MPTINIGPCDCCGSSSSTTSSSSTSSSSTTTTTGTGTTGTGTTDTTTTGTTDTTTTGFDCCDSWAQVGLSYPVDVNLSNTNSCDCGGSGFGDLYGQGNGTFTGSVVLCDPVSIEGCEFAGITLGLVVECPSVSSSGNWRLSWNLYGACSASGSLDASSSSCNRTSFEALFGPISGIPSDDCCDDNCDGSGGTGSGFWTITLSDV